MFSRILLLSALDLGFGDVREGWDQKFKFSRLCPRPITIQAAALAEAYESLLSAAGSEATNPIAPFQKI